MSANRAMEWERRLAAPFAIAAFAAAGLFIAGIVVGQSVVANSAAELLREVHENSGVLLLSSSLKAVAIALFAAPLYYLFQAAATRSQVMRRGLVGAVVVGPLFLGAVEIFQWIALDRAATDFATPGGGAGIPVGEYAEDLIEDQGAFGVAQGLRFAGVIGFVFALIYTALQAMRVGLLTRFFATLGMALGAALVLLVQALALLALMLWLVWLGLIFLGRVPGGRPPAWDAGSAIPWAKPGEERAEPPPRDDAIEGEGAELAEPAENPHTARRERAKRRKRKRRG
jgi:hypothetical protein